MKVLNLTQHRATTSQMEVGVHDPFGQDRETVRDLLTFEEIPDPRELETRAARIAVVAAGYHWDVTDVQGNPVTRSAMIGGAPFFMSYLEEALWAKGIRPLYAFSRREAVEVPDGKGGVRKDSVFTHLGWVPAPNRIPPF